jgi:hypothetical protein
VVDSFNLRLETNDKSRDSHGVEIYFPGPFLQSLFWSNVIPVPDSRENALKGNDDDDIDGKKKRNYFAIAIRSILFLCFASPSPFIAAESHHLFISIIAFGIQYEFSSSV